MVERYIKWVLRNRFVVLAVCALMSVLAITVVKDGVFASSLVKLFLGDSPDYRRFQQLSEEFGSGDLIFVAIEDASAFSDDGWKRLERVAERIQAIEAFSAASTIADADFIPRMSGATLVNLLLDITNFDYKNQAERDVEQALRELQSRFAGPSDPGSAKSKSVFNIDEDDIQTVMGYVNRGLEKVSMSTVSAERETQEGDEPNKGKDIQKMEPVLFPPGECIHF